MRHGMLIIALFCAINVHADGPRVAEPLVLPPAPNREPARIPSAREAEAMRIKKKHGDQGLGFFVGLEGNLGRDFIFSNTDFSQNGITQTGSATLSSSLAVGLRLGLEMMPDNGFGFQTSVAFETPRNVSAINTSLSGEITNPSTPTNGRVQFNLVEVDGIYRWHTLYIPIGINYSIPISSNLNSPVVSYSLNGSVGGQMGLGGAFYGGLRVEALLSVLAMQLRASGTDATNTPYTEAFGTGYLATAEIRAHWTF